MADDTIVCAEFAWLTALRPRTAGANARLTSHGRDFRVPVARVTTRDGFSGTGPCLREDCALDSVIGQRLASLFDSDGVAPRCVGFECALWDLRARSEGRPAHALLASVANMPA